MPNVTPESVVNYGALIIFFVVVLSFVAYYLWKLMPEDRKYQREMNQMIFEQVALSRQALETSNMVIQQNSDEMKDNRTSHSRIGERLGCLEEKVERHDTRAEQIALNVEAIRTKLDA